MGWNDYLERIKMENSRKLKHIDYNGYSTNIQSYENKAKLFIKTEANAYDFNINSKQILNEFIGFAILKEMSKEFKRIKTPKFTNISFKVYESEVKYYGGNNSERSVGRLIEKAIAPQFITSSFKVKTKTIQDSDIRKTSTAQIFSIYLNLMLPNMLIGNEDAHSGNYIIKENNKFVKDYYIIDLGNAFQKIDETLAEELKEMILYERKTNPSNNDKKSKYVSKDFSELIKDDKTGRRMSKILLKHRDFINNMDLNSIVNKKVAIFKQLYKKAFKELLNEMEKASKFDTLEIAKRMENKILNKIDKFSEDYIEILNENKRAINSLITKIEEVIAKRAKKRRK